MKRNVRALALLVMCLSAGSRLHAMDWNSDSESSDREQEIQQEYEKKVLEIRQAYEGSLKIENEHYEALQGLDEKQRKKATKKHLKNKDLIKLRCEERLAANDRKKLKNEQRLTDLLAKQPEGDQNSEQ